VSFRNEGAGIPLAGTLTRPPQDAVEEGGAPGVVLVAGSGAQDRDGTIMGHEPLHVLADHLTREGIAVLRFDERGVAASGGTQRGATTQDLAGDVEAAVQFLAEQPGVDPDRVGIVGHSEGGLIAPMTANRTDRVAFVVLLAAPGRPGSEVLAAQLDRINENRGADRRTRAMQRGTQQRIFQALQQDADSADIATELKKIMREAQGIQGEQAIESEVRRLMTPWFRFFIAYDPRPALQELDVPVLALTGSKDLQVGADENLAAIDDALESGANPPHTVRQLDGLNHLLQPADTGSPQEYARIETTMAPEALDQIATWIRETAGEGK
jgi:pimeloyl-ACP methyl ester carboxylesterase